MILPGQKHDLVGTPRLTAGLSFGALTADRAFDADQLLKELEERGSEAVIPPPPPRHAERAPFFAPLRLPESRFMFGSDRITLGDNLGKSRLKTSAAESRIGDPVPGCRRSSDQRRVPDL